MVENKGCIFCSIVKGTVPASVVASTDDLVVIKDIAPKAPLHYLIIPKKHIDDIRSFEEQDRSIAAEFFFMAKRLSLDLQNASFKLVINNGREAGQHVFHTHCHFLSGASKADV